MHSNFTAFVEQLHPKFEALVSSTPSKLANLPKDIPERGIYLLSEAEEHLYVGRSNNIRKRLKLHSRVGSRHNQATFAFKILRKELRLERASYRAGEHSRAGIALKFADTFLKSKERIREMDVRFVQENDPTSQALLEIYVHVALKTPYNDFDNH